MVDMQLQLLKKVEELTIYTVELKKEVEKLKKENVSIQNQMNKKPRK